VILLKTIPEGICSQHEQLHLKLCGQLKFFRYPVKFDSRQTLWEIGDPFISCFPVWVSNKKTDFSFLLSRTANMSGPRERVLELSKATCIVPGSLGLDSCLPCKKSNRKRSLKYRPSWDTNNNFSFFSLNLVTAIGGRPKPELCFLPGRSCPSSYTAIYSVAVDRTPNLSIDRRTLYHWAMAA